MGLTSVASRDAGWQDADYAVGIDAELHFEYLISDPCQVCSDKQMVLAGQAEAERC
jgi:hypothetical protein